MVLQAQQYGAFAFLEKPATHQKILDCVWKALAFDRVKRKHEAQEAELARVFSRLSPREFEVLEKLMEGLANKEIAAALGISERTLYRKLKRYNLA